MRKFVDDILANRALRLAKAGYSVEYPEEFRNRLAECGGDIDAIETMIMRYERVVAPGYWL